MTEDLTGLVTRGFQGVADQLRERDSKVASLSEAMVEVRLKVDQLKETLANKGETDRIAMRVEALEQASKEVRARQSDNAKWIKGLVGSLILLVIGYVIQQVAK